MGSLCLLQLVRGMCQLLGSDCVFQFWMPREDTLSYCELHEWVWVCWVTVGMGAPASLSGSLLLLEISWFHAVLGYTQIGSVWKLGEASMPPWLSIGSASCPALLATGTEGSLRIIWLLTCSVLEGIQPLLGNELAVSPFHGISKAEWR